MAFHRALQRDVAAKKNTISNGLELNSNLEYKGFGANGVSNTNILLNIGIGTMFDKGVGALQNLTGGYTPGQVTRFKSLSYKPKYALQLQQYEMRNQISNVFNTVPGQLGTGAAGNLLSTDTKKQGDQ